MLNDKNGYIKLYRSLLKWEWYQDTVVKCLFLHLLLLASFQEKKWQGQVIKPGQLVTSYKSLSRDLGFTVNQIRTAFNKLKATGEITNETTNRFSLVTIVNWEVYQSADDEITSKTTSKNTDKSHSNHTQITLKSHHLKNVKNDKNVKNNKREVFAPPTYDEVAAYCKERNNGIDAQQFINFYESKGWMIGKNKMKDWKAAVRTWENRNKPATKKQAETSYDISKISNKFNNFD